MAFSVHNRLLFSHSRMALSIAAAIFFLSISSTSFGAMLAVDLNRLPQLHTTTRFLFIDENVQEGEPMSTRPSALGWVKDATRNWMSELPDSTSLAHISIPGTHDSAARFGLVWCQTQSRSFSEQLEGGIRYFDIRNRRIGESFALHHAQCFQDIFFGDVLNQMKDFLERHPGEVILMRVKEEYEPDSNLSFAEIWERYMRTYGSMFLKETDRIPNLGEARGKILVLRNAAFSGYGIQFEGSLTDIQDKYKVGDILDGDSITPGEKRRLIKEFIDLAGNTDKLVLNHLSGASWLFTPTSLAVLINPDIYSFIGNHMGKRRLGVLIMDYPGDKLVYRIIKSNFEAP